MDTQQTPVDSATAPSSPSPAVQIAALIATFVALVALLDLAIETIIGGSPLRWWVAPPAVVFVAVVVWLWRPGGPLARRFGWTGAAVATIGGLAVLLAASAWGPGGLAQGVRLAGQPTSAVLAVLSLCAVAMSAAALLRARVLPLWFRLAAAALAAYAFAAFALGVVRGVPFPALFHGAGLWTALPAWLQGPFVGTVVVLPLGAIALAAAWLKARRMPGGRPVRVRSSVVLAAGFTAGLAAILSVGGGGANSWTASGSPGAAGGAGEFPWRAERIAPAATEAERQAAIEQAGGEFRQARAVAAELRQSPIGLDEALEKIGRDPAALARWIQQRIAFEPYEGFMKGPQGTLVSGRANSADKALLLAELLKRAGVSVRLVRGTLPADQQPKAGLPEDLSRPPTDAQVNDVAKRLGMDGAALRTALNAAQVRHEKLLENLWTRTDRDIGAVAGALSAARVSVPATTAWQAPAEHWWVRTEAGDLDPTLGQAAGTETAACALDDIPADRFHTVTIRMRVAGRGGETAFLDRSFRSVDLFGQTVAVANAPVGFAKALESGGKLTVQAIFAAAGAVTEFQPQIVVGGKTLKGDAFDLDGKKVAPKGGRSDKAKDLGGGMGGLFGGLSGGEGEEAKPAKASSGTMRLTAAYLEVELIAPGAAQPVRIRRDLLRPESSGRQRVLDLLAVREIVVMPDEVTPDFVNNAVLEYADAWRKWLGEHRMADYNPLKVNEYQSQPYFDPTLCRFGMLRRNQLRRLSETRLGGAQWVHPRPMVVSYVRRLLDATRPTMVAGIDIFENTLVPLGPAAGDWRRQLAFAAGMLDTALEHEVIAGPGTRSNTSVYLEQALAKGQQPVAAQGSLPRDVRLSAVARAQLQEQLRGAAVVLVPQEPSSWYRVDLATGATLGYVEGGGGQEMAEYAELIALDIEMYSTFKFWADLFKCIAMGVETPLAGYETPLMGLEECFKLMCGSVAGVVGKVTEAEGLLAALLGLGIDEIYGKLCQKLWDTMTGKGGGGGK
jgi:hypothetical protein